MASLDTVSLGSRLANAAIAYMLYLAKTVWPRPLAIFYPLHQDWSAGPLLVAGLGLLTFSAAALLTARRRPYFTVGWLWFLGTLVPVIGLVQVGGQAMADRYTYLPLIGIFILVAWGVPELLNRWRGRPWALGALGSAAILACLTATVLHLPRWKNTETLCRHALRVTTNNFVAHTALGADLFGRGRRAEAKAEFASALSIAPGYFSALIGMGQLVLTSGDEEQAAVLFRRALEVRPRDVAAHCLLGSVLARQENLDEAASHFEQAILLDPDFPAAHVGLAGILVARGQADAALRRGLIALRLAPDSPDSHFAVAGALFLQGRFPEAVLHYQAALGAKPDFFEARLNCGVALQNLGKLEAAGAHLREAVRLKPDNVEARGLLAAVYSAQKRDRDQAHEYAEMLRLRPDWPEVLNNLAWLLATHLNAQARDGARAVPLAERACQLTGSTNLWFLSTLAAAYAEAGRFAEAVSTQQKVCDLAAAQRHTAQAEAFQSRLELYRAGQAYHQP